MELLSIKGNRPYQTRDKIEYNRDLCLLNFSASGEWELEVNEEKVKGRRISELSDIFKTLRQLKKNKHRTQSVRRLVIWTNELSQVINLIAFVCKSSFKNKNTQTKKTIRNLCMWMNDDDFEFRNFNAISGANAKRIGEIYGFGGSEVDIMKQYIKMQPSQNWASFRFTASHCFEKQFEKRAEKNLDEKLKKAFNDELKARANNGNLDFNKWIKKGCLGGALWINKDVNRKVIKNVASFDINQAYGGQFVRSNDFPLGEIIDSKLPKNEIMKLKWYCFVFEFDKEPNFPFVWMAPFEENGKWYLVMEKWDIECMKLVGAKFNIKPRIIHQFICRDSDIGFLNFGVRKTINDLYNERQELKKDGNKMEKIVKQINEVIYGKGLQDRQVRNHYFCPQISYHALAKTRYEICLMLGRIRNGIACDTDSIKTIDKNAVQVFVNRNIEIEKELAAAGFTNTQIGTWKFEGIYSKFIQYEKKVYAYENEGKLECKFAGCNKEQLSKFLIDCRDMNGLMNCLSIPGGVIEKRLEVDDDFYAIKTIYRDYSLDKNEMEAFFKRQEIVYEVA